MEPSTFCCAFFLQALGWDGRTGGGTPPRGKSFVLTKMLFSLNVTFKQRNAFI